MTRRTDALADRLEQGANDLAALAASLTDAEWRKRLPGDGRSVGVVVHHVASMYPLEIELAREVASSRSNVAQRFTELVGQPPMQYLAQWRMQVAANRLTGSTAKLAAIAAEVGYESEAAFSRAFKRATGLSPGAWREARRVGS